ncbi:MAG TPA: hypothetical protein DIT43_04435 [Dehalococcoidia bacterium]|nr:hypothetical protein [Dehalococcoidia bacterium]
MAKTLEEMVSQGERKFRAKEPVMGANYDAAKSDMKTSYGELPFGPNTKAAYSAGIDAAKWRMPDIAKWARNWMRKIRR